MTSEERKEIRYQRRKAKRDEQRRKRSSDCGSFEEIFSFRHLYLSGKKCCKGVYWKNSTQRYIGNIIPNTAKTAREIQDDTFRHRGFHSFDIWERGKRRHIRSVHITERVVQKCLCDYCIVPVYSACFIYDNSASLKGRGMDFALRRMVCQLQRHCRRYGNTGYILVYDFHAFFDSAPHAPLFAEAKRRLLDERTRVFANSFISDFGEVGLGLGSQISQTNALLLPNALDHFCKERLRISGYGRYMDDGYLLCNDREYLEYCLTEIKALCSDIGLTLNQKKTRILPITDGFRFLKTKFVLTESGQVVLRMNRDSTIIMRRKLRAFKQWLNDGTFTVT